MSTRSVMAEYLYPNIDQGWWKYCVPWNWFRSLAKIMVSLLYAAGAIYSVTLEYDAVSWVINYLNLQGHTLNNEGRSINTRYSYLRGKKGPVVGVKLYVI